MDFEFTDDQLDLRDNARKVLESACPPSLVRVGVRRRGRRRRAVGHPRRPRLARRSACPRTHGGLGLGFLEVGIVVEELGRVVAPSPFLATVTQLAPLVREAGSSFRLADIAHGRVHRHPRPRRGRPVAPRRHRARRPRRAGGGWVLDGVKTHVLDGATADEIAVVARGDDGLGAFVVPGADGAATRGAT